MEFEELIKAMSGHELATSEINKIAKEAQETFGLSSEATDDLKMLLLTTSKKFQDYIFATTYKK